MAGALIDSDVSIQSRYELCPVRMILHRVRIGFRVGQHFAGRIDDRRARARGLGYLRSDVRQFVLAVGINPLSKNQRFLGEVALNLLSQRAFPDFCGP